MDPELKGSGREAAVGREWRIAPDGGRPETMRAGAGDGPHCLFGQLTLGVKRLGRFWGPKRNDRSRSSRLRRHQASCALASTSPLATLNRSSGSRQILIYY